MALCLSDAGLRAYVRGCRRVIEGDQNNISSSDLVYAAAGQVLGLRTHAKPDAALKFADTILARLESGSHPNATSTLRQTPLMRLGWDCLPSSLRPLPG